MDITDTVAWLRPDGRLVHTVPHDLPRDGDGLWLYRPRDPARPPVLILIARQPDGAIRIVVAEVGGGAPGANGLQVHRQLIASRRPPNPARPDEAVPPVDAATALIAAMAWADRPSPP